MRKGAWRVLVAVAAVAAAPASAEGHAIVTMPGGTIVYTATDAGAESTVAVTVGDANVRITDTTVNGGMDPGPCDPGAVDRRGFIIEVTCPRKPDTTLRIEVGVGDDTIKVREASGARPANAVLDGGSGQDALEGGAGDDELRARDGGLDVPVSCGAGSDRAFVDVADITDGCEVAEQADPSSPPPPEESGPPPDMRPPEIDAEAARHQRIGPSARLRAIASVDEVAQVAASARVRLGKRRLTFKGHPVRAETPGERFGLRLTASPSTARRLRRALGHGRRLYAVVTIVAVDDTGNSFALRLPRIRLTR